MRVRRTAIGVACLGVMALTSPAAACPYCNIFNYLAPSVCTSRQIVVARILAPASDGEAEVEVIRVLRGDLTPNARVKWKVYSDQNDVGQTWILLDPRGIEPSYESLPLWFEPEVKYLMRITAIPPESVEVLAYRHAPEGLPAMANLSEAIACFQGASKTTRHRALDYFLEHGKDLTPRLKGEVLRNLAPAPDCSDSWRAYRVTNLVEALLLRADDDAKDFLLDQTRQVCARPQTAVNWSTMPDESPFYGKYLTVLLLVPTGQARSTDGSYRVRVPLQPDLARRIRKIAVEAFPRLDGTELAEATYALRMSDSLSLAELERLVPSIAQDEFALGLMWVALEHNNAWSYEVGLKYLKEARKHAKDGNLVKALDRFLERLAKMNKTTEADVHLVQAEPVPDVTPAAFAWRKWVWFAAGGAALAFVGFAIVLTIRRRRRARTTHG